MNKLKKNFNRSKRKILVIIRSTSKTIKQFITKHIRTILYGIVFLIGAALIIYSFFLEENWTNIASGVGTGLLTSLVVSIAINHENDARAKRKLEEDKKFILNDIVYSSTVVYIDIIYRINEYIMFTNIVPNSIYCLYDDFKMYNEFENEIKQIDIKQISEDDRKHLNTLFHIGNYSIDYLVAELKRLPKHEYYLKGILTQDEYSGLTSNFANDTYLDYAEHLQNFWNDEILDYEKCISFLRMTLYICCKIISSIDYCKKKVITKEDDVKEKLSQQYYNEIYSQSEEYIQEQMERQEAEYQYYAEHPEEWEKMQQEFNEWENETPEDRHLKNLYYAICGFSAYSVDEIIAKLDRNSSNVLRFLLQDDIQQSLKKNRKKHKSIKNKFGKDYLQRARKVEEDKTNG